jgi:cytochrome c oxidase subunit IV
MQAPGIFLLQFFGHVGSRAGGLYSPLKSVLDDFQYRYLVTYWDVLSGFLRARILVLVAYLAGLLLLIFWQRTWRDPKLRLLVLLPAVTYVATAILDGAKYQNYFIHIYPLFCLSLAAAFCLRISGNKKAFRPAAAAIGLLLVLQAGGTAVRIARNTNANVYRPVIDFLIAHRTPGARIVGASELMFGLGREFPLDDDQRLGIYTGEKCDFLVRGAFQEGPEYFAAAEPETAEKMRRKLEKFELIFERGGLRVYVPKEAAARNRKWRTAAGAPVRFLPGVPTP